MDKLLGFLSPIIVYAFITLLNAIIPGRWVTGYVTKVNSTQKLRYRLNGLQVLLIVLGTWVALCYYGLLEWDWFYLYRWYSLAGAVFFGLVFSIFMVIKKPAVKKSFLADFYFGRVENPQLWGGRIDAKMWLYLIGAIMLALNVLSFTAHHYILFGAQSSPGVFIATGLISFFVLDYLTFEEVHLYTYDLFAEKVGFKLGWGCIAFYPYFYSIPFWSTANLPDAHTPTPLLILYIILFFLSWSLSRGANLQKYFFKKDPNKKFLGIRPQTISDGKRTLLVNGFWGLSRHINYLGEIGMATGIVLCLGHPLLVWPWLYPLYYILLLFPRQIDDDKRCKLKYGPLWEEYVKKVPYRIIPKIY
jgi:protein-S-isoprenylcysteine O-methyltransferase Ste14